MPSNSIFLHPRSVCGRQSLLEQRSETVILEYSVVVIIKNTLVTKRCWIFGPEISISPEKRGREIIRSLWKRRAPEEEGGERLEAQPARARQPRWGPQNIKTQVSAWRMLTAAWNHGGIILSAPGNTGFCDFSFLGIPFAIVSLFFSSWSCILCAFQSTHFHLWGSNVIEFCHSRLINTLPKIRF